MPPGSHSRSIVAARARRVRRLSIALPIAALAAGMVAGAAQAHVLKDFGPYTVALGWVHEPTYVGQLNAVQVVVKDKAGKPVTDLAAGDLTVVVTAGGQDSAALPLVPTYDEDTGLGTPGDYEAPLIPTIPGDYTFHLTGKIHDAAVDETATSSDSTFDSAADDTDIQFPAKVPTLTEVTTRLDRLDTRVAALASAAPSTAPVASGAPDTSAMDALNAQLSSAQTAATQARDSASTALLVAIALGGLGVVLGAAGLYAATRRRTGSGS